MTWVGIGSAAVGVVGSALLSDDKPSGGGAGTSTASKDPWAPAQPWLMQNIAAGQGLQDRYTRQPFSPQQTAAYNNQYGQSDYMRRLVPSLLGQLQGQQTGFDSKNPSARAKPWDWGGLLAGGGPNLGQTQLGSLPIPAAPVAAADDRGLGSFIQQTNSDVNQQLFDQQRMYGDRFGGAVPDNPFGQAGNRNNSALFNGGFGEFRYGQEAPAPGTRAYRDMQEYFAYGGSDPYGIYGKGPASSMQVLMQQYGGNGAADGNSSGSATGAAASDGSGGGTGF